MSNLLIKASSNSSITASFSDGFQDMDALLKLTSRHRCTEKKFFTERTVNAKAIERYCSNSCNYKAYCNNGTQFNKY